MLSQIAPGASDALMLGFETDDDSAVYRISDDIAVLLSVDFFTPIVDDPYDFGRIAAANALSDIYAMGGQPLTAMNLLAFPCSLGPDIVGEVVRGGAEKVAEAGAVTVGGHTIDDKEPKFGLSVMGTVHPDQVIRNRGAKPGDAIVLTKPLGTGLWGTALKRGKADPGSRSSLGAARAAIESMVQLNREAAEAMVSVGVSAATDVTGFGLAGHLHEMTKASGCSAFIDLEGVPLLVGALEWAAADVVPGRTTEIIAWASKFMRWQADADEELWMKVLCDPQTSGGLMMAVPAQNLDGLVSRLEGSGVLAAVIGAFTKGDPGHIAVR